MHAVFVTGMTPNNVALLMLPKLLVFTSVLCNVTMEILEGFLEPIRFFTQEVNKPPRWGGEFVYPHELEFYSTNFVKLLEFH